MKKDFGRKAIKDLLEGDFEKKLFIEPHHNVGFGNNQFLNAVV